MQSIAKHTIAVRCRGVIERNKIKGYRVNNYHAVKRQQSLSLKTRNLDKQTNETSDDDKEEAQRERETAKKKAHYV